LLCEIPFGLNQRKQCVWFYDGEGAELMNEFGMKFNSIPFVGGGTGCQIGEWFRKEIKEVSVLKGLKLRSGGFTGVTIQKLDGIPQQITGDDRYLALERGTIGATEGIALYDTRSSGSVRSRNTTTIRVFAADHACVS
jgi:TRAP-type mannitol/chloroaromatic compound transport system substrate-binding protein